MSITVLSMSMLMVPLTVGAAAQAGDLIKMDGLSSVYYLGADGKRYVFPNEATYFSWYSDFSGVVTVPQSELESYPLGANVTMRAGTKLVKITTNPKVYAVEPGGNLRPIPDETTAAALWGANWNQRIVDVPDAFFTNYTTLTNEVSATAYPAGSLVKYGTGADTYYIDADGMARKIADEAAFMANGFSWDNVVTSTLTMPTAGADITGAETGISDTSEGAGGVAGAGTGLTVALSSATPAAGNIPAGSPNEFLKLSFTAAADGAVNVNSITLTSYNLGTPTYVDSVTFFDEGGLKVGNAKNMNSDGVAVFNFATPFNVPAGTTKTLLVKATIEAGQTSGNFALGVKAVSDIVTNGAVVSGSFPVIGNTKAVVSATIGTVALSNPGLTDVSVEFGEDDVLLASFDLTTANENILWETARFKNGGTNSDSIVSNLRLMINDDEAATAAGLSDKYVTFNLDSFVMNKGETYNVEVYGDIGTTRVLDTVDLYVYDNIDFSFVGQKYGYGVQMTNTLLAAAASGIVATLAAGDFTIDMDKVATPAKDVRAGDNDVVLATMKLTSNGENATLTQMNGSSDNFIITGTGLECNEIENTELRDVDTGVVYDVTVASGTASWTCALTMTDEISFVKGVTRTFQVRTDLKSSTEDSVNYISGDDTLKVTLKSGAISSYLTGDTSDASITNITPSSVTGSIATVKASALTWEVTALTDKTIVPGASDIVIYKSTLEAGASSYIDITSVKLTVSADNGDYTGSFVDSNVSALKLYLDGKLLKTLSNQIADDTDGTATDNYIDFTSLDTTNRRIAAGTKVNLEVIADFASSFATTSTFSLKLATDADVSSKDMDSRAVDETVTNGTSASRSLTLASTGTLKAQIEIDDTKADVDTYILAGAETTHGRYLGEIIFTTANEPVKVKTLLLKRASGATFTSSDVKYVRLYDKDGAMVAEKAPDANGAVNFDTFNYVLPADQATSLFIGVLTKTINKEGDTEGTARQGRSIKFMFDDDTTAITAEGVDSGDAITMTLDDNGTLIDNEYERAAEGVTKETKITGSVLTSIVNTMSDAVLVGGNGKIIGKYKFVFDNGLNRSTTTNEALLAEMKTLVLNVATSTGVLVSGIQAYIDGNSSAKTTAVNVDANGEATISLSTLDGTTEKVDGEVTLVIIGNISGVSTTDYVQTEIDNLATDFTYDGESGYAVDFSNTRLDITEVIGGTASN